MLPSIHSHRSQLGCFSRVDLGMGGGSTSHESKLSKLLVSRGSTMLRTQGNKGRQGEGQHCKAASQEGRQGCR